jgi:hypothetical protein
MGLRAMSGQRLHSNFWFAAIAAEIERRQAITAAGADGARERLFAGTRAHSCFLPRWAHTPTRACCASLTRWWRKAVRLCDRASGTGLARVITSGERSLSAPPPARQPAQPGLLVILPPLVLMVILGLAALPVLLVILALPSQVAIPARLLVPVQQAIPVPPAALALSVSPERQEPLASPEQQVIPAPLVPSVPPVALAPLDRLALEEMLDQQEAQAIPIHRSTGRQPKDLLPKPRLHKGSVADSLNAAELKALLAQHLEGRRPL